MKKKTFIALFIICFLIAGVTYKYPSFNTLEGAINYDYQNGKDLSKLYQFNNEAFAVSASPKSYHEFSHYVKKKGKWTNTLESCTPVFIHPDYHNPQKTKNWHYEYYVSPKTNRVFLAIIISFPNQTNCKNQTINDSLHNEFNLAYCYENVVKYVTIFNFSKINDYSIEVNGENFDIDLKEWKK